LEPSDDVGVGADVQTAFWSQRQIGIDGNVGDRYRIADQPVAALQMVVDNTQHFFGGLPGRYRIDIATEFVVYTQLGRAVEDFIGGAVDSQAAICAS